MATAEAVLSAGKKLAGENEAVVGQNQTTINRYYNMPGQPYCAAFVAYCLHQAGMTLLDGCAGVANVGNQARYLEAKGLRVSTPKPGDIFVEKDSKGNDNAHEGLVCQVLGNGTFLTLEGNYNGVYATMPKAKAGGAGAYEGIGYRVAAVSGRKFYRPPYDGAASGSGGSTPAPAPVPAKTMPTKAEAIADWQSWLGVDADGEYGPDTERAAMERMLLGMLDKHPLRRGASGAAVKALQGRLLAAGYDPRGDDPDGIDGEYGPDTAAAVRSYQADSDDLAVDGEAGVKTVAALFGLHR